VDNSRVEEEKIGENILAVVLVCVATAGQVGNMATTNYTLEIVCKKKTIGLSVKSIGLFTVEIL